MIHIFIVRMLLSEGNGDSVNRKQKMLSKLTFFIYYIML